MRHRQAIALLALIGFFVALYLWLYKIGAIGSLKCGAAGTCEYVQTSPQSMFLGAPVAFYGVLGYVALFAIALLGLRPAWLDRREPTRWLAGLATGGVLFTAYLTYVELFVLHAICKWCVGSAVIITAIWVVAVLGLRRENRE